MRKTLAILICSVYLMGSCISFIPPVYYFINKTYIAENLCQNKDKVEVHCEGKCFVGKEIIKLNKQKQDSRHQEDLSQQHEIFPHEGMNRVALFCFEQVVLLVRIDMPPHTCAAHIQLLSPPPEYLG